MVAGDADSPGGKDGVVDRLIVDLYPDGRAMVSTWPEGDDLPDPGPAFDLIWPVDADALADLQWYLEDYLAAPFEVYGERGPQVEALLAEWGTLVFGALFGSGVRSGRLHQAEEPPGPGSSWCSVHPRQGCWACRGS